ncbi:GNAT family N-acetyltransferase [bacterium]|nr:GNAT family N-acetyltransferase [bacterium]
MSLFSPDTLFLETKRLYLRCPQLTDWGNWREVYTKNWDWLTVWEQERPEDYLINFSHFSELVENAELDFFDDSGYKFFIFEKQQNLLLGGISLSNIVRGCFQSCHCGYWMRQEFARQGFMSEALKEILIFVFRHLKLHRIQASCVLENFRSKGLLEKLEFRNEGIAQKYLKINGEWRDHFRFAMTLEDFLNKKDFV